jgi:hypothetical protein
MIMGASVGTAADHDQKAMIGGHIDQPSIRMELGVRLDWLSSNVAA